MSRRRDHLIDKKIGSVICMQRAKLRMSQGELWQRVGGYLPADTKIRERHKRGGFDPHPRLCRVIEISPNGLFRVSDRMNSEVSQLSSWAMKTALKLQELAPAARQAVDTLDRGAA